MLRKILLMATVLAAMAVAASAQNDKPRIYINNFQIASGVSQANGSAIYQAILSAINETKRFEVATEGMESALSQEIARRTKEAAMHDASTRNEILKAAGCKYVMSGQIQKCQVTEKKNSEGNRYYECILSYSISVAEVATSTTVASEAFDNTGSKSVIGGFLGGIPDTGSTSEEAINGGIRSIRREVGRFIMENFPNEGILVTSDYEVKKDKLLSCYINLGSQQGVKVGDLFYVMAPKIVLGNVTYSEIGRVKVDEVVAPSISHCKVIAGPKEIYQAVENHLSLDEASQENQKIKVVSMVRTTVL